MIGNKAARRKASDKDQVMLYMYLLPLVHPDLRCRAITGLAVDVQFVASVKGLMATLSERTPAMAVLSWGECRCC